MSHVHVSPPVGGAGSPPSTIADSRRAQIVEGSGGQDVEHDLRDVFVGHLEDVAANHEKAGVCVSLGQDARLGPQRPGGTVGR